SRAAITQYGDGSAKFAWKTPQKSDADLGSVAIDFTVSDGHSSATQTVTIQVKSSTGNNQQPQFVSPLGYGTTLDLTRAKCLDLEVTVQDANVPSVEITQTAPAIDGATLMASRPLSAKGHARPTAAQRQGSDA